MRSSVLKIEQSTVMPNEALREQAHVILDNLMNRADGIQGAFGVLGIDIPFQNGYFQSIGEKFEQRHK